MPPSYPISALPSALTVFCPHCLPLCTQPAFSDSVSINDPPPLTSVAVATRLVVASTIVHLLASDEPVGQYQLQQLVAYMQVRQVHNMQVTAVCMRMQYVCTCVCVY